VECGAFSHFAFDPDAASHRFGQPLADGQAQAGAAVFACRRGVGLAEGLKQALDGVGRDADAGVAHREVQLEPAVAVALPFVERPRVHGESDFAPVFAPRRELHRVAQEVDQDLAHPRDIADHPAGRLQLNQAAEFDSLLVGALRDEFEGRLDALAHTEGLPHPFIPTGRLST
jgi:hypothetical protein